MASIVDQTRDSHAEIEILQKKVAELLLLEPKTTKQKILHEHKIAKLLEEIQSRERSLMKIYADRDGARQTEIEKMGQDEDAQSQFTYFYDRLKRLKEYHRKFPQGMADDNDGIPEIDEETLVSFTGEEQLGRFLDFQPLHHEYVNLKHVEPIDYITYLGKVSHFEDIPRRSKSLNAYRMYLEHLKDYLVDYHHRVEPLIESKDIEKEGVTQFEADWNANLSPGWGSEWFAAKKNAAEEASITTKTTDKEEATGDQDEEMPDADTEEKQESKSLYCEACEKQFAKETVFNGHLKGKKHVMNEKRMKTAVSLEKNKELAKMEAVCRQFLSEFEDRLEATIDWANKKYTMTAQEREKEFMEGDDADDPDESESEDEENKAIYNPKGVPLGWDGKPIPYWLYKLHGLGMEFQCEICGNFSYWGRKAYERHFQEWRHAHGMACLKIPNTRHFHEINLIADALALWEKIKDEQQIEEGRKATLEEYEDADGNVMDRKTFEDLKRQGLIE